MTKEIERLAPEIFKIIGDSNSILLHCHPSPDPDSVGSVLAMKLALESIGKKITAIRGDSVIPEAFMHFPGAEKIVNQNYIELDKTGIDLFLILDSGSVQMVSSKGEVNLSMKTINIDHHASNNGVGSVNLIDHTYSSTCEMLYDLFIKWGIKIDHDIAVNLFLGMYSDTGGFKYESVTLNTYETATKLVSIAPDFHKYIFIMENSNTPNDIIFQGLALSSIKNYYNDNLAISAISQDSLKKVNLNFDTKYALHTISNMLKSVIGWNIGVCLIELEPNVNKISMRTRDSSKYDVSKLAVALGGGGHRAASGATLKMPFEDAVKKIVETAKIIYNL